MDKGINKMVYPCNGKSLGHKQEWSTDSCYNLGYPWKQYTKWKKQDKKVHILWFYLKCAEWANP